MQIEKFVDVNAGVVKTPAADPMVTRGTARVAFAIAERLGRGPRAGSRVLDFGCGIGNLVTVLIEDGYDAHGVDIGEWWGKHYSSYWKDDPKPPAHIRERLAVVGEPFKLPYPSSSFDFALSLQVFEHVSDYRTVFQEIARVLKPRALSVHVFPGRGTLIEPHLSIPITALCHHDWWLRTWSFVSRRHRKMWSEEYAYLRDNMVSNHYPSKRKLKSYARDVGVNIYFTEFLYIEESESRPARILNAARRLRLGWLVRPLLLRLCQRCMIITSSSEPSQ